MNAQLKRAIGHSETKLHDFVLTVYFLQNFELREMLREYCGMGDWHVVDPKPARNIEDVELPSDDVDCACTSRHWHRNQEEYASKQGFFHKRTIYQSVSIATACART